MMKLTELHVPIVHNRGDHIAACDPHETVHENGAAFAVFTHALKAVATVRLTCGSSVVYLLQYGPRSSSSWPPLICNMSLPQ